ncbi:MAG TPA: hypothetical protein VGN18_11145 [Jatrophihabitans sp.]|uniref:hypothetical protein n=1 Tax=Jatrophihabitans sp. TaxID=1932789 RepID=UPI002E079EFE|nr:hypothetical protein [Jatrophihabitans sp.]
MNKALRGADRFIVVITAIVVAQMIFLGLLMRAGWYYQADLANLAEATGKPLSWSYLSAPQGGHFVMPVRFMFWVLNRVAPLNYAVTIVLRLVGQALATGLLARLLVLLVGRRRIVVAAVALYAFSPFLIQADLWLSASVGLIGAQLLLIAAISNHVRYSLDRRMSRAVATAACVVGATLLSEQAAVTAVVLPILSFGYLTSGSASARVRGVLSCWREWLCIGVPMFGYVAYYFSGTGGYGVAAHPLGITSALDVIRVEWTKTIAPGLIGGPWRWFSAGDNFLGLSNPSTTTQVLCLAVVVAVIGLSIRAQGWRALAAWSMPLVVSAVGIVVVAVGRYAAFGIVISQQFEHAYYAALPAAVATTLAFSGLDTEQVRRRLSGDATAAGRPSVDPAATPRSAAARRLRLLPHCVVVAVVTSSIFSGVTYAQLWARSPAHRYVSTLERSLREAKPGTALYDSPVPTRIIPLEATHYVSDIVGLTDVRADFSYTAPRPSLVDANGRVVPAAFFVQTEVDLSEPQFCNFPVQGTTIVTRPFRAVARRNDWYLQIGYFQQYASVVAVTVIDRDGRERLPTAGTRQLLPAGLGRLHLMFRHTSPAAVRIRSLSPATNLCVTGAQIGFPFAVKKAG